MVPEEEDELVVPETRGAARPHEAPTPAPASVLVKPKYHRRIPVPSRGVHPSWSKSASTDDSTCIERARDRVLGFLAQPLLSVWTLVGIVHMLAIVGVGAWFFFLLVDSLRPFRNFALTDDAREIFMNVGLQSLTALFTWSALLTMPWRLSNATHLTYNTGRDSCNTCAGRLCCAAGKPRSCAPGLDFYGKPTESIWFHIPTFHRRAIVSLLIVSTFAQFMAQAARIVYNSWELSTSHPGSAWCNATFFTSMGAALTAAFYQLLQERRLRREEPERFPPGPLEDIALSYRSWRRGLWTILPRDKHHHERVRQRAVKRSMAAQGGLATTEVSLTEPKAAAPSAASIIGRGAATLAELPWLLEDAITGEREPPNPTAGPRLTIVRAAVAPPSIAGAYKRYVAVSVSRDGGYKYDFVARTHAAESLRPVWDVALSLGKAAHEWGDKARLKLLLLEETTLGSMRSTTFVGMVIVTLAELRASHSQQELLFEDTDGNPVLSGEPLVPCLLTCAFSAAEAEAKSNEPQHQVPSDIEQPVEAAPSYPRHAFLMTRGTRGDVQPFVALARGLCNERGWLVTICTEARWKAWVLAQCADITAGAVRFLCSGGDTQRQTETWVSKEIMGSKSEALQELMLAASEANFFASAPVFMHHLGQLQAAAAPKVDLIINAFTLTGVALMCGEAHAIPVAGFCLQPTCIPSDDDDWHAIVPIDSGGDSLIERAEAKLFTSHTSLKPVRRAFNHFPWSGLSLPALRAQFGLESSITWKAVFKWQLPLVIPMLPSSFKRPSDWPASFACTDFLFLRSSAPGGGKLATDQAAFVEAARAKGRKLMVMTFSSMPVPRAACLTAAVEMLTKSKHDFALLYVGKRQPDAVPARLMAQVEELTAAGKLLEAERADFGVLFRQMDAFVVHGGLGTTVEALRMRKPTAVTGILLMDQRFWGLVCHEKGCGPKPVHIESFKDIATDWADRALDPESDYSKAAAALAFGDEDNDGVTANVNEFVRLIESGVERSDGTTAVLGPPKGHKAKLESGAPLPNAVPHGGQAYPQTA